MKFWMFAQYSVIAAMVAVCSQVSSAHATSSCQDHRKAVKVASARLAKAIQKGANTKAERLRIKTLKSAYRKKVKVYDASCFQEVCGYKPFSCPEGLLCVQMVTTQTYKGLNAMKLDGAQLLHSGACLQ